MIFTERIITVVNDSATINKPLILYRGDKNIELKITIAESQFKFRNTDASNVIETTDASYAQLVINTPYNSPIFSDVAATKNGAVIFVITEAMIDEIREVGAYEIQIRLLDDNKQSRASIPPVSNAIEIREPIAIEDGSAVDSNAVNTARVNRALTTTSAPLEAFDSQGNYIKKTWGDGDPITDAALNKMEAGIEGVNNKAKNIPTNLSQLTNDTNFVNETFVNDAIAGITGVSTVEPAALDMPKVFFNGDKPTDKTSVYATIEYISKTQHFKGYVDIKCQGTSSMAYPKKNYTIKIFSDEAKTTKLKKDFKGWGKQSKFCLKANYIDHSHARNIVSAKLWGQVVKSRSDFDTLPEELKTSPNYGAVDGFPIKVYYNGTYEGVYTWNIPKDGWMNNMDDKLDTHCILCGEEYSSGCFREANASLWSDELHDVMPANIVTSFNAFQNFVINSSDDEFKTGLSTYADINSLIDYYIFQYVICGLDSMGKNQLFFTYDGTKWMASSYDMDSTFGLYWNGQSFVSATYRMQEDYESMGSGRPGNLLYIRLEELFYEEIKARYAELRAGVLSYANIVNEFEKFMDVIGKDLYAEDLTLYTEIPSGDTNNIQQIRSYTRDRLAYVDSIVLMLGVNIPCTSIALNKTELALGIIQSDSMEPYNYLSEVGSRIEGNDLCFDSIKLGPGLYEFKNINGGTFSWLGYAINGGSFIQNENIPNPIILNLNSTSHVIFKAYPGDNLANNTPDKLAVYKKINDAYSTEIVKMSSQLTATVEPSDTTDIITWSVEPSSIVKVVNGLITAKTNGEAVITATCGTQSATCNVTVAGLVEESISYELAEETVFNGTDTFIDTGISLLSDDNVDKDWTMLVDFTSNSVEEPRAIVHCMLEADPFPGLNLDFNNGSIRAVVPNNSNHIISSSDTNRHKVVITKSANTFTVYNESMEQLGTNTPDTITTITKTLLLGAFQDASGTKGRFFNGTIHKFKLVEGVMSREECLNWMA